MLRSCIDALLQVAAQTGPLEGDPATASSSADQDALSATRSRQHGEASSSIDAQAASAAEEAGLDAESAAPAAPQPQGVPPDDEAAAPVADAESLAASGVQASLPCSLS